MTAFDVFYYSFSPGVAKSLSENNVARVVVKTSLYPLVNVLQMTSGIYSILPFTAESAMVLTGVMAAALLGLIYVLPASLLVSFIFHKKSTKQ